MYGFGGPGEVEVEIWSDVTIAGQPTKKERQGYSAIGPWKAEMSNMKKMCPFLSIDFLVLITNIALSHLRSTKSTTAAKALFLPPRQVGQTF